MQMWPYVIIYNDGSQNRGQVPASSYSEACAKVESMARCGAPAHRGVANIIVG